MLLPHLLFVLACQRVYAFFDIWEPPDVKELGAVLDGRSSYKPT